MNSIEENEEKNDIITVCKYLVANSVNNLPIKCSDITKNCLRGESRLLPKIIEKISDTIFDVYGLDLNEIKDDKMGKIIVLTSKFPIVSMHALTEAQKVERRLLFLVLSIIHMKGGEMFETQLLNFISKMEFNEDEDVFGDVKKIITETFVSQMYLKRSLVKLENSEEEKFQYTWANRAFLEYSPEEIEENVAEIMGGSSLQLIDRAEETEQRNNSQLETSDIEMQ